MKGGNGVADLGFFIDRTIKQCLEYDLDLNDTDAVLEDMAKEWPPEDASDHSSPPGRERENTPRWTTARSNMNGMGNVRHVCQCRKYDSNRIAASRLQSCKNPPVYAAPSPGHRGTDRGVVELCVPGLPCRGRSLDIEHESSMVSRRPSGLDLGHSETLRVGVENLYAVDDGDEDEGQGPLRRSHSCEELIKLERPLRQDCERHASPSPEIKRDSPNSRPAKLKSRLQLRYLEEEDERNTPPGGRVSDTMDANSTANSTDGTPSPCDIEIDVERESPIPILMRPIQHQTDVSVHPHDNTLRDKKRHSGDFQDESAGSVSPKKIICRDTSVEFSRFPQQQQQLGMPRSASPLVPIPTFRHAHPSLRPEAAVEYRTVSNTMFREDVQSSANLPRLIRQGLDMASIRGALRHPQTIPPPHLAEFFSTQPQLSGPRPVARRESPTTDVRPGQQRPQNPQERQQQQQQGRCKCKECGLYQRDHYHQRNQRDEPQTALDRSNSYSMKNPMHRIASIIAEELQRDDGNSSDGCRAMARRKSGGAVLCNGRCSHLHSRSNRQPDESHSRSPPVGELAQRRASSQNSSTVPCGFTHRDAPEPSQEQSSGADLPPVPKSFRNDLLLHEGFQQARSHPLDKQHLSHLERRHHQIISPERRSLGNPGHTMPGTDGCQGITGSPPPLSRLPQPIARDFHLGSQISTQHPHPAHELRDHLGRPQSQYPRVVPTVIQQGATPTSAHFNTFHPSIEIRSAQAPPPSHQPHFSHAVNAPPAHNILLPSHHPLSHLSSTRVPMHVGSDADQDQPEDLSNKSRGTANTTPTTTKGNDAASSTNAQTGSSSPRCSPNNTPSTARESSEKPGPAADVESKPLNLALKDRHSWGFLSTPSSPETRVSSKSTGRKTP